MISRRAKRISTGAAAAALLLVAAVLISRHFVLEPGEATGDPFPIIYAGCCPQRTGEVFDARGVKVRETAGTDYWQFALPGNFELYFDVPDDACGVYFPGHQQIEMVGENPRYPGAREKLRHAAAGIDSRVYDAARGRRLLVIAHVPETCMKRFPPFWDLNLIRWDAPVTEVDVELTFWSGPRGEARWTFEGPFEPGMTVGLPGSEEAVKVYEHYDLGGDWGTRIELVGFPREVLSDRIGGRVFGYDWEGRRYSTDGVPSGARAMFHRLQPERLAAVTVGETPRRRTFHDIRVRRPGAKPLSDRPPMTEAVAAALGIETDRNTFRNGPKITSTEDALKVLDCAFGAIARSVWYTLKRKDGGLDFSQVDAELRQDIIDRVLLWMESDDSSVRAMGLEAAGDTGWKEFIPHLFEHLEHDRARRWYAAFALMRMWWQLSPADIEKLSDYLRGNERPASVSILFRIFEKGAGNANLSQAALAVLVEFAGADEPWLWWRALKSEKALEVLGESADWPLEMRARRLLVTDFENAEADEDAAARAHEILLSILTARFMAADSRTFMDVLDRATEHLDPETATPAMVALLEEQFHPWVVARVVAHINRSHGVNIAGVGSEVQEAQVRPRLYNWAQVARDAVVWHRTGTVPRNVPEGYRAGPEDLRLVFVSGENLENSLIGLWVHPDNSSDAARVFTVKSEDRALAFSIGFRRGLKTGGGPGYVSQYGIYLAVERAGERAGSYERIAVDDLPHTVTYGQKGTVTVEHADSPESVLSGTKVFGQWWERHGPREAGRDEGGAR